MIKRIILSFVCIFSVILCFADRITVGSFCYNITSGSSEASLAPNYSGKENSYSGDVVIPSSFTYQGKEYKVTKISYAFNSCPELTSVTIPDGIKEIEDGSFSSCPKLKTIAIPNTVEKIGCGVFSGCDILDDIQLNTNNSHFVFKNNMLFSFDGKTLYQVLGIANGNLVVPEGVTTIKDEAISSCWNVSSVSLPNSLTYIGKKAFYNLSRVKSISIPQNVSYIGEGAFVYCSSRFSISIEETNSFYKMENGMLLSKDASLLLYVSGEPDAVSIPESVTRIGAYALADLIKIKSLLVPDNVQTIGKYAFTNCFKLESVTLGCAVKEIEPFAFDRCDYFSSFTVRATNPPAISFGGSFNSRQLKATLIVPKGSMEAYKSAEVWKSFDNIEEFDATNIKTVVDSSDNTPTAIYDANGIKRQSLSKGLNIIRMANGSIKKVMK